MYSPHRTAGNPRRSRLRRQEKNADARPNETTYTHRTPCSISQKRLVGRSLLPPPVFPRRPYPFTDTVTISNKALHQEHIKTSNRSATIHSIKNHNRIPQIIQLTFYLRPAPQDCVAYLLPPILPCTTSPSLR